MAFPRLNAWSFWMTAFGVALYFSFIGGNGLYGAGWLPTSDGLLTLHSPPAHSHEATVPISGRCPCSSPDSAASGRPSIFWSQSCACAFPA
jgi:hypothetical protein